MHGIYEIFIKSVFIMKKFFLLIVPVLALVGCSFQNTYNGFTVESYDVHVSASDWSYTNMATNNYFRCVIDMPEITRSVFDKGEVQAFRILYDQNNEPFKHVLPDVFHQKDIIQNQEFLYTTTVDCLYGVGWLEFNYRVSDFAYDEGDYRLFAPEAMDFTVVITTKD